jgi:hypothetical protein
MEAEAKGSTTTGTFALLLSLALLVAGIIAKLEDATWQMVPFAAMAITLGVLIFAAVFATVVVLIGRLSGGTPKFLIALNVCFGLFALLLAISQIGIEYWKDMQARKGAAANVTEETMRS